MTHANTPSQTREQNDSGQPRNVRGKREDTLSLLPEGEAEEKERKRSYRRRAERSFQKDMLRDYTYRYNTLRSELQQSSSRKTEDRESQIKRGEEYNARRG